MPTTTISISPDLLVQYPRVEAAGMGVSFASASGLAVAIDALKPRIADVTRQLAEYPQISDHPRVSPWRAAYAAMGVKPSRYRSSIEALLRRAQKQQDLTTGLPIVDLYNAISIITVAPMGAYDAAKVAGRAIELRLCRPATDRFDPLGAAAADFPLKAGLVVYASGDDVLCWGFNCRDAKLTAIDEGTMRAVFFCETADADAGQKPAEALTELEASALSAGARCGRIVVLSREAPVAEIDVPA